jgi:hypothetical protein
MRPGTPDPAAADATDQAGYPAFARTAADIDTRIRYLLPVLAITIRRPPQRAPSEQASRRDRRSRAAQRPAVTGHRQIPAKATRPR